MADLLRHGDRTRRYTTRSEVVQALAVAAVNAGWSRQQLLDELLDPRNEGGARVRQQRDADAYVARSWTRAAEFIAASPPISDPSAARAAIAELRDLADAHPDRWRGKTGLTDRKVFEAHLEIATAAAHLQHTASIRQVAETAGVHRDTVLRAQGRLRADRLLTLVDVGEGTLASRWRLPDPQRVSWPNTATSPHTPTPGASGRVPPRHDLWRMRALGSAAWQVARHLHAQALTLDQLAAATRLHRRTLQRALQRLVNHRLVEKVRDAWQLVSDEFDQAARRAGLAGAGQRQRVVHLEDRQAYRLWRARRRLAFVGDQPHTLVDPVTGETWFVDRSSRALVEPEAA